MKIIGITYYDGSENVVLKSDSSMTVNRKPLFVPEAISDLQALLCVVLRVSRLGRCIAPRFASRYYDALAAGMDYFGADNLREARAAGKPWTEAVAFEGSLAIGSWQPAVNGQWSLSRGEQVINRGEWTPAEEILNSAVARASELLTIRQGDLIYVALNAQPWQLQPNDLIRCTDGEKELLYCKIK